MSRQAVEQLMDKWMNEPEFRDEFRANPEQTIKAGGYEFDDAEWAAVRSMDWNASDDELALRARQNLAG